MPTRRCLPIAHDALSVQVSSRMRAGGRDSDGLPVQIAKRRPVAAEKRSDMRWVPELSVRYVASVAIISTGIDSGRRRGEISSAGAGVQRPRGPASRRSREVGDGRDETTGRRHGQCGSI